MAETKVDRTLDKFYFLEGDEKAKIGNAAVVDDSIQGDFFNNKTPDFKLNKPLEFKINEGRFSGIIGDCQFNNCGFNLFSERLRAIIEKFLTPIDAPAWFPATVTDLQGTVHPYLILHLFNRPDMLDRVNSTFVPGTNHPIKRRYDLDKIGDRLIFARTELRSSLCVHDVVRKEIKKSDCIGIYFYKIHSAGRLH